MSTYVGLLGMLTSHTLPFFWLQYKTWAREWHRKTGPQEHSRTHKHNRAGVQSSSQPCWHPASQQDRTTEKSVGKDGRAGMRCQPCDTKASAVPVTLSSSVPHAQLGSASCS